MLGWYWRSGREGCWDSIGGRREKVAGKVLEVRERRVLERY